MKPAQPQPLIPRHAVEPLLLSALRHPNKTALIESRSAASLSYGDLGRAVSKVAAQLRRLLPQPGERVAVHVGKTFDSVIAMYATLLAGGIAVPINPSLKPKQVRHILSDSGAQVICTTSQRLAQLAPELQPDLPLTDAVLLDSSTPAATDLPGTLRLHDLATTAIADIDTDADTEQALEQTEPLATDLAALLYTSGSTGLPKGVMLSHTNLLYGADSVSRYLGLDSDDRLLAVLPLSFDYGLNQLNAAFYQGATAVLMEYLLPREVISAAERHAITTIAGVPPLWMALAPLPWPKAVQDGLRRITNSGGAMPPATTRELQENLPSTDIYLMYGLTEAFRSTFLPPHLATTMPESIGKAIPHARISVRKQDGNMAAPDDNGELVHEGPLVAAGYWCNPEATAVRFKPVAGAMAYAGHSPAIAVWSGDQVSADQNGFLKFIARADEMIKTSGYRVSPLEVELAATSTGLATEAVAFGIPDPGIGQKIVLVVVLQADVSTDSLRKQMARELPAWMVPQVLCPVPSLPRNPNGKLDRSGIKQAHMAKQADNIT